MDRCARGTIWPTTELPCGWSITFPERIWMALPSGCQAGHPSLVLTLRYDRIDNFWFSLLPELAHLGCHLDGSSEAFVDDLERPSDDAREAKAGAWAQEVLFGRN